MTVRTSGVVSSCFWLHLQSVATWPTASVRSSRCRPVNQSGTRLTDPFSRVFTRKHDDDRRFVCTEEGCGKSFTRAEHLKGHSITHLGTKPFQCHAEGNHASLARSLTLKQPTLLTLFRPVCCSGCNAKFSARSSLYIHSKKHKQDASTLRTRCPVANCSKHFSSRSSLKSHMLKHHHLSPGPLITVIKLKLHFSGSVLFGLTSQLSSSEYYLVHSFGIKPPEDT